MIVVSALVKDAVAFGTTAASSAVSAALSNRHDVGQDTTGGARGWAAMKSGNARTAARTTGSGASPVTNTAAAKATRRTGQDREVSEQAAISASLPVQRTECEEEPLLPGSLKPGSAEQYVLSA